MDLYYEINAENPPWQTAPGSKSSMRPQATGARSTPSPTSISGRRTMARWPRWRAISASASSTGACTSTSTPPAAATSAPFWSASSPTAAREGKPLVIRSLTHETMEQLESLYPGRFTFTPDRDAYDYLYEIDALADLKGKKLQAKRNHINRFVEAYPDWYTRVITVHNLHVCESWLSGGTRATTNPPPTAGRSPRPSSTSKRWSLRASSSMPRRAIRGLFHGQPHQRRHLRREL